MLSWALLTVKEQVEGNLICLRSRKHSSLFLLIEDLQWVLQDKKVYEEVCNMC